MRTQTAQLRLLVAEATAWSRGNMGSAANSDGGGAACRKTEADWCEADWPGMATGWSATWHKMGAERPDSSRFRSGRRDSIMPRNSAIDSEAHRCRRAAWHWAIRLRKGGVRVDRSDVVWGAARMMLRCSSPWPSWKQTTPAVPAAAARARCSPGTHVRVLPRGVVRRSRMPRKR